VTTGAGRGASGGGPESSRYEIGGKTITGGERLRVPRRMGQQQVFLLRLGRQDPEAQRRRRGADIEFSATMQVTRGHNLHTAGATSPRPCRARCWAWCTR
jgi:hypothetical protein